MELHFLVQTQEDGMLLRDFLRRRKVSAGLMTQIKAAGGFFQVFATNQQCPVTLLNAPTQARMAQATPIRTNQRVCAGQVLGFALPPEKPTSVVPEALPLSIVAQDDCVMVLNKPAGQVIHPTLGYKDGTLANAFCGEMHRRGKVQPFRPINRIDRNTSGLVLCAMNAYAAAVLAANTKKVYYALVQGALPQQKGVIDAPIGLAPNSILKRCVDATGKASQTAYEVLATGGGISLVQAIPITGRTHQIRVHFSHLGCPLVGDDFYGGTTELLRRHALHCGQMQYLHPVCGEVHKIGAPLAEDMRQIVQKNLHLTAFDIA